MNDTLGEIRRLNADGYCCSQILMLMALDRLGGDDNPELVDAMYGLCAGLYSGLNCGILSGAACLLTMIDRENAKLYMIPKLVTWFRETWTPLYDGIDCNDIIDGNPVNKMDRCPVILAKTFAKCQELVAEFGHEL